MQDIIVVHLILIPVSDELLIFPGNYHSKAPGRADTENPAIRLLDCWSDIFQVSDRKSNVAYAEK